MAGPGQDLIFNATFVHALKAHIVDIDNLVRQFFPFAGIIRLIRRAVNSHLQYSMVL